MNFINNIPQIGRVEWIGLRPARREPMHVVPSAEIVETGLAGDFFRGAVGAPRAITLIQAEHLGVVSSILGKEVRPELVRRNIVVSGINLKSLKQKKFRLGTAILFGTGNCSPCSFMEEQLGSGGYNAMRGHGGITAQILQPGIVRVGDQVEYLAASEVDKETDR